MKLSMEEAFTRLLDKDPPPTIEECAALFKKYVPKRFKEWSGLLRRLADYIDTLPEPVMLSAQQVGALISLVQFELHPPEKK